MKKMIIPRSDHEVYFIPLDDGLNDGGVPSRELRPFILERLDSLHPGFSSALALDLKLFVFEKKRWAMATVMEAETLAEYKILHRRTVFYTNTSIAAHGKDFINSGVNAIWDELIGFDREKNAPVSIPREASSLQGLSTPKGLGKESGKEDARSLSGNAGTACDHLKKLPSRYGVFGQRTLRQLLQSFPRRRIAAIAAGFALLFIPLVFFVGGKAAVKTAEAEPYVPFMEALTEPEESLLPGALEILARFSSDLIDARSLPGSSGGKMSRWHYDEEGGSLIAIQISGVSVLTLQQIFKSYDYLVFEDVKEVQYSEGEPFLTALLNRKKKEYTRNTAAASQSRDISFPAVAALADDLIRQKISIVSEALPTAANNSYTVSYTAKDKNLLTSMELINALCDEREFKVKRLDVSINGEHNGERSLFSVVCTLAPSDSAQPGSVNSNRPAEGAGKIPAGKIPEAFGYKEAKVFQAAVKPPEKSQEQPVVGSIKDNNRQIVFYRDSGDGKIKTW
jgi:hypothetical protein